MCSNNALPTVSHDGFSGTINSTAASWTGQAAFQCVDGSFSELAIPASFCNLTAISWVCAFSGSGDYVWDGPQTAVANPTGSACTPSGSTQLFPAANLGAGSSNAYLDTWVCSCGAGTTCAPSARSSSGCPVIANGSSVRTCAANGSAWGACSSACNAGFTSSGAQPNITCTAAACTPSWNWDMVSGNLGGVGSVGDPLCAGYPNPTSAGMACSSSQNANSSIICLDGGIDPFAYSCEDSCTHSACGSAHGQSFNANPITNLCANASYSPYRWGNAGDGPWYWSCGSSTFCSATKTAAASDCIELQLGSTYTWGPGNNCSVTLPVINFLGDNVTPTPANRTTLTNANAGYTGTIDVACYDSDPVVGNAAREATPGPSGSGGGTCTAAGVCGTAAGSLTASTIAPASSLCSSGAASAVVANAALWEWTCASTPCNTPRLYIVGQTAFADEAGATYNSVTCCARAQIRLHTGGPPNGEYGTKCIDTAGVVSTSGVSSNSINLASGGPFTLIRWSDGSCEGPSTVQCVAQTITWSAGNCSAVFPMTNPGSNSISKTNTLSGYIGDASFACNAMGSWVTAAPASGGSCAAAPITCYYDRGIGATGCDTYTYGPFPNDGSCDADRISYSALGGACNITPYTSAVCQCSTSGGNCTASSLSWLSGATRCYANFPTTSALDTTTVISVLYSSFLNFI